MQITKTSTNKEWKLKNKQHALKTTPPKNTKQTTIVYARWVHGCELRDEKTRFHGDGFLGGGGGQVALELKDCLFLQLAGLPLVAPHLLHGPSRPQPWCWAASGSVYSRGKIPTVNYNPFTCF